MALTQIRGEQIQQAAINNSNVAGPTSSRWDQGLTYNKLNLANSIVGTDLNPNHSVEIKVLDYHNVALWDIVLNQTVSGTTSDITAVVKAAASVDTARIGTSNKGILMTGTGASGAGTENYKVQIRDAATKDPIHDGLNGSVYAQLTSSAIDDDTGTYTLAFKKSDGTAFSMASKEIFQVQTVADVSGSLSGTYFTFSSPTTDYYAWFNINAIKEVTELEFSSAFTGVALQGAYFNLNSVNTQYYVYFRVDGQGADPAIAGKTGLAVDIASSSTRQQIAAAVNGVIEALTGVFTSSVVGTKVTITNVVGGAVTVPSDHNVGVVFTVTKEGKSIASDPLISGKTGVAISLSENANASTVASAIATAIGGVTGVFTASAVGSTVTVNNINSGTTKSVQDGSGYYETGFNFTISTYGTPAAVDFMFLEVYSYETAPVTGFVTGFGFADVVGVAGTHNHNDLYYTKYEIENGQLDNRYYTITQLQGGSLDSRYYTKADLDPIAVQDGNVLDKRYFTETELSSSSTGSAGASLIGVTPGTATAPERAISSSNVQAALVELQSDINDIITGQAGVSFSLDDAYNDGAVVVVDGKNDAGVAVSGKNSVDWQLDDGQAFKVTTDGGATSALKAEAKLAGDEVSVNAIFGVTGPTTLTGSTTAVGDLNQTTGKINFVTGAGKDATINANALNLDGVADSHLNVTSANLTVGTTTTGSVNITAANSVLLKDSNLTAALPLSQAGQAALSNKFVSATSIVGALNETAVALDTLEKVTLPSQVSGSSGASKVGVTGITGVIPTGGSVGSDGNVQTMLEGIALGASGGKTFADITAFTTAKSGGTYFKLNEPVFILDTNRWVIVEAQGTGVVENTDWGYVGGLNRKITGSDVDIEQTSSIYLSAPNVGIQATDTAEIIASNVASIDLNDGKTWVNLQKNSGTGVTTTRISGDIVDIDGVSTIDLDAPTITIDGQTTITGTVDTNVLATTSGTGQTKLASAEEIDLTGGKIDINAGTGKTVTIDSDTAINLNTNNGEMPSGQIRLNSAQITLNGPIITGGASLTSTVSGTDASAYSVTSDGGIDLNAGTQFTIDRTGGGSIGITSSGSSYMSSAAGQNLNVSTTGAGMTTISSETRAILGSTGTGDDAVVIGADNGGISIEANATKTLSLNGGYIDLNGVISGVNTVDQDMHFVTSGNGQIVLQSESELNVNAPYTSIAGDVTMPVDSWLSVGNVKITSVDPIDEATITGSRSGTVNSLNKLVNTGFENGTTINAADWTKNDTVVRTNMNRYYGSYAMRHQNTTFFEGNLNLVSQDVSDLTANTAHMASLYVFGTVVGTISAQIGTGTMTQLVPAGTYTTWTRFNVELPADNPASGAFRLILSSSQNNNFYFDAVMLEEGSTLHDYFSDYKSELVMTIGDNDDDRLVFRSVGSATKDLMRINQSTVEVLGNLLVSGTTTTVNSEDMLVANNEIVLNSNVTGAPMLDAFFKVERGTSDDVAIRWNETLDKWELTNDGTSYSQIVTSGSGGVGLSLDTAYDGGSSVTVDNTDVAWSLASGKNFIIADGTDTNKFVVSAGSGVDSVKIDTTGGINIDAKAGIAINEDSGSSIILDATGFIDINAATDKNVSMTTSGTGETSLNSNKQTNIFSNGDSDAAIYIKALNGGVDIDVGATKPITVDSGSFSIDGVLASNVSTTGANLTLSTITSGDLLLSSAGKIVETGTEIDLTAANIVATGATQVIGNLNLDGSFDQTGNYTFKIDTDDTSLTSVDIETAGGIKFVAASDYAVGATNIKTTGILTQTGAVGVTGDVTVTGKLNATGSEMKLTSTGTGGTHLALVSADAASITSVGMTLDAGTGAFDLEGDAASTVNVTGANLTVGTTGSGYVVLQSAGAITFQDAIATSPVSFSQTSAGSLSSKFVYNSQTAFNWTSRPTGNSAITSVVGAINANRQDLWEYVELLNTQGAAVGVAAGANLIGVKGITGVIPTGKTLNANSNLQEMLEGIAMGAGGGKTFADIAAFTTAKSGGTYFGLNEPVFILDTNRWVIVKTQSTSIVSGTDYEYVASTAKKIGGTEYKFNISGTAVDSFNVVTAGGIDISAASSISLANTAGSSLVVATDGAVTLTGVKPIAISGSDTVAITSNKASSGSGTALSLISAVGTGTNDIKIASANGGVDIESAKPFLVTSGGLNVASSAASSIAVTGGDLSLSTATSGKVAINSIGAVEIDGNAASHVNVTGAALAITTTTSGNISLNSAGDLTFKDTRVLSPIRFSDSAAGNNSLPAGTTSILGAIKAAFDNTGMESRVNYYEVSVSSAVAAQNCVVVPGGETDPGVDLPVLSDAGNGWANLVPSALRTRTPKVFVSVYLNGLRLSDSEWDYVYDINGAGTGNDYFAGQANSKIIRFASAQNVTLVSGDKVFIEITMNKSGVVTPGV